MAGWAENAVREASDLLAMAGRTDLASDLNRVLVAVDFDDLDTMRSAEAERLADEILEAETLSELAGLLKKLSSLIGVDHCSLHVVSEAPSTNFETKVLTTYPEAWISRYLNRRYFFVDPVAQTCRMEQHNFFWDSLDISNLMVRSFWLDAAAFGIGPSGYTTVITTERGDRIALSISSSAAYESFRAAVTRHQNDLTALGFFLSEAFCRLASEDRPSSFHPTDDQLMVLRKIANGAAESDLRNQTFLYGSYSTIERSICSLFRTRTVAQAAVLAARIGLLDHAPLMRDDFVTAPGEVRRGTTTADEMMSCVA